MASPEKTPTGRQTLDSLWIQIKNNRIQSIGDQGFFPPASISSIFTPPAIDAAVAELSCAAEDRIGLANAIREGGTITFAILVWISRPDSVVAFRRKRYLDRLPLDEDTAFRALGEQKDAREFVRIQWEFLPYHFHREKDEEIDREILPFIRNLGPVGSGAFGDIDKLEIHPSLQDFMPQNSERVVVVRKKLRVKPRVSDEARRALFVNEKRCLRLINHPLHPNIVPLLASYTYGPDYCLLFPLLDMDLKEFLSLEKPYGLFSRRFTYFSALHGLASALERAHDVRIRSDGADFDGIGYHHDIRPANVLVSRETFLLADFGMGRVRGTEDGPNDRFKAHAGDYIAPECTDEDFNPLDVGRTVDVWAFGCLMSEVLTYAYSGVDGVRKYRDHRKFCRPSGEVIDSLFHDGVGLLKTEVKNWVGSLATKEAHSPLGVAFRDQLMSILTPAVPLRPMISGVRLNLAHINLKAHFFAVLDALADVVDGDDSVASRGSIMKLWFEQERLRAWGDVVCLSGTATDTALEFVGQHGEGCVSTLLQLFYKLQESIDGETGLDRPMREPHDFELNRSSTLQSERTLVGDHEDEVKSAPRVLDAVDERNVLDSEARRLIQAIWDLLPQADSRRAERIWVHSILDVTDSIDRLGNIEKTLYSQQPIAYQRGRAMTRMKMIRLEILEHHTNREDLHSLEIPDDRIPTLDEETTNEHQLGIYDGKTRVLVESIVYGPGWENIPPEEQTTVMAYKAKGFNVKPRPIALRLLDCIGFYETGKLKDNGIKGFSFVYRLPDHGLEKSLDPATEPEKRSLTTLYGLLSRFSKLPRAEQSVNQPFLGDKFKLASALAGFLAEFHTAGWLHENFRSNNIVYFCQAPASKNEDLSPTDVILSEPFIVGLNKSRPGGDAWHTSGPTEEADFIEYRHPAYQDTHRFRRAYDYYSLGIVLLEIGLWTTITSIAMRREYRTLSPGELRDTIVSRYVPRLGHKMGKTYRDIVNALLSDQLDPHPKRGVVDRETENHGFSNFLEIVYQLEELAGGKI